MKTKFILLILSATSVVTACSGDQQTIVEETKPQVKIARVASVPVQQTMESTGTVEPFKQNYISPSMPVRIDKILVEVGDHVREGQILVRMEDSQFRQQNVQLENLRLDYERIQNLYEAGGVSRQEVDRIRTNLEVMESSFSNLTDNLELKSPLNGVVTARNYDNGDMFSASPILSVEQLNPVKTTIYVTEEFFPRIQQGLKVDVRLDIYPDEVFEGKIHIVYPTIDPVTRTVKVELVVNNDKSRIRPGMFARATLFFGEEQRVVLPDVAVVKQPGTGDRYVYVFREGKVYYTKVMLGARYPSGYEVLSGLSDGEEVVVAGQTRLVDDIEVEVIP